MIARGSVVDVSDCFVDARMPALPMGSAVRIASHSGWKRGRVVRSNAQCVRIALAHAHDGIVPGDGIEEDLQGSRIVLGSAALGRAIDGYGAPLDGAPVLQGARSAATIHRLGECERRAVVEPLWTGVRAIDALLTIGRGARVGIFGSPGAGKSSLVQTIVEGARADAVVLALVGERGREAERWIALRDRRSTIVCATSDRSASERIACTHAAFAHAYALARRGLHVLLVLDSLARVAYALRELAVAGGEPAGRGGYPASTFASLARLVESAGAMRNGSISLLATVLNDGDDRDPVSEGARSLLDGHIQLSAALANAGRFPAIDVLASASRTMADVVTAEHARAAIRIRGALAALEASRELRSLGVEPSDEPGRAALAAEPAIETLLRQGLRPTSPGEALGMLFETADTLGEPHEHRV